MAQGFADGTVGYLVTLMDERGTRIHKRLGSRIPVGGLIGAIVGSAIGLALGHVMFDRTGAILTAILGSAIFGFGVGMLVAGYSSLESPDPGTEPSDTPDPVGDLPGAVREEHPRT